MQNVIYISRVCSEKMFDTLMKKGRTLFQPAQKFHKLMIEGLSENNIKVNCLSSTPLPIEDKLFNISLNEYQNNISYHYSYSSKHMILNRILIIIFSFFSTIKYNKKNDTFIISDVLDISLAIGSLIAAKIIKCEYIALITDFPEDLGNKKFFSKICHFIIKYSDGYIFLSEHMKDKINIQSKKYTIIEGLVNHSIKNEMNCIENKIYNSEIKVCMYAGALEEKYGVKMMVDSFAQINNPNYILYIYGYGSLENYIKKISSNNDRIVYFGLVNNKKVVEMETKVDLLINPRLGNESFTLYSFPSKNMEYLVSGTPMLCAKLGCIPDEYNQFCYFFKNENDFSEKLQYILSKNKEELYEFGKKSKEWVLKSKNNIIQTKKILLMFKEEVN